MRLPYRRLLLLLMTQDEWKAELVERTLADDWPVKRYDRELLMLGPCAVCDSLGWLKAGVDTSDLLMCYCGARASLIDGDIILPCKRCNGIVGRLELVYGAGQDNYRRLRCHCGFMVARC